ncbi:rhodanese-like domain-containing protein [Candidatus Microgenomates bacterium]|nr:MAG: rhodanese-like domain-containing protein [Candidatus Microgenomates bacterium]
MDVIKIPQVTVDEVNDAINEKKDCILLDVRTPAELTRGKITGCINIPVDEIKEKIVSTVPDKSKIIYVYCLSGSRSDVAVSIMRSVGYRKAFSMAHGLLEWRMKKYPLV